MKQDMRLLYETILKLDSVADCEDFFEDLCTANEIEQMTQRIRAAELLLSGNTYSQVMAQTDISSATLSRVSNAVRRGKGYKRFIKKD